MTAPPNLLNDDGSASIATAFMMSHHGFRRDLARFASALDRVAPGDATRAGALAEEWKSFHETLHGHHHSEDTGIFPGLAEQHASVRATIERLSADHRKIDPLLLRGDQAFGTLPEAADVAAAVVRELRALLDPHLATEEAEIVPYLRDAKAFPPPPDDATVALYAQGFAWAMHGIAPEVLEKVSSILPEAIVRRLPDARASFEERCMRVWGTARAGAARTPIPSGGDGWPGSSTAR